MWRPDGNHEAGSEVAKVRWELVPYMRGNALDLGCGPYKAFPHFWGVDSGKDEQLFGVQMRPDIRSDVADLKRLASGEYDCVFSSHVLEHLPDYKAALKEWWRLVKVGGYLILYLPHADLYPRTVGRDEWKSWCKENALKFPNIDSAAQAYAEEKKAAGAKTIGEMYAGTIFANPDHAHDFLPEDITKALKDAGAQFDLVRNEVRDQDDEYSFFVVYQKLEQGFRESWKNPKPAKTCAIVRYGAIGDNIMVSSILPWLKEQGYWIDYYCQSGQGYEAIKHDPNVDRFIVQDRDAIPNQYLGQFFEYTKKKYDKWIDLCGSVEGSLLPGPSSPSFRWPNAMRAAHFDKNYLEWTHEIAGVPPPYRPKFYSTPKEKEKARWTARKWGRRNILWSLAGSSGHKVWPHLDAVIASVLLEYQDVHIVLVGDDACKLLQQGWGKYDEAKDEMIATDPRMHLMCGKWSIRESMAFAEQADLVIGTETGLLNAVGCMDVPKIVTLSHSSEEMLTKHWKNVIALSQPKGVGCSKQPCRQLHGSEGSDPWLDCPQEKETGTSLCQFNIGPDVMWQAVQRVLGVPVQLHRRAA